MKSLQKWVMGALLSLMMGWAGAADFTLGPGDIVKVSVYGNPDLGIETRISEAGMPAIADPGSSVVRAAHAMGLRVCPLVGPVSRVLALAGS